MHAHASDKRLTESGSAKFWVKSDGSTVVQNRGILTDREINKIQKYIQKIIWKCMKSGARIAIMVFMRVNNMEKKA